MLPLVVGVAVVVRGVVLVIVLPSVQHLEPEMNCARTLLPLLLLFC